MKFPKKESRDDWGVPDYYTHQIDLWRKELRRYLRAIKKVYDDNIQSSSEKELATHLLKEWL
jgi:hypothetical protein